MTIENEELLWKHDQFGMKTPRSLLQTVWWFVSQHFGIRGRSEHHQLKIEDFRIETEDGREQIIFDEGLTKNHAGGLNFKPRIIRPRMYATNDARCPVAYFKLYQKKRPISIQKKGPFYLTIIECPKDPNVWYKSVPMGINTIGSLLKGMVSRTPLVSVDKKFTNHSSRKTSVRKMKSSGFVNSQIKHVTSHRNEKSLDAYDSGDEQELQGLSSAISNFKPSSTVTRPVLQNVNKYKDQVYLKQKSLEKNFSLLPKQSNNYSYIFNNCTNVTINTVETSPKISNKRRRVILSDSEDE